MLDSNQNFQVKYRKVVKKKLTSYDVLESMMKRAQYKEMWEIINKKEKTLTFKRGKAFNSFRLKDDNRELMAIIDDFTITFHIDDEKISNSYDVSFIVEQDRLNDEQHIEDTMVLNEKEKTSVDHYFRDILALKHNVKYNDMDDTLVLFMNEIRGNSNE